MNCSLRRTSQAFTLVELLVSIAIIALLIGITIPALSSAFSAGKRIKSLANLRSAGQTVSLYHNRYETYPYATYGFPRPQAEHKVAVAFPIWAIDRYWPLTMHEVAPWEDHIETWFSPGVDRQLIQDMLDGTIQASTGIVPSYRYSQSFVGDPSIWSERPAQGEARAIRPHEVAFPSEKVLMFDQDRFYLKEDVREDRPRPVLMADGSAAARDDSDAAKPIENPLSEFEAQIFHDTPNGVHGRDFGG